MTINPENRATRITRSVHAGQFRLPQLKIKTMKILLTLDVVLLSAMNAQAAPDEANTIHAGAGDTTIQGGSSSSDFLYGGARNDVIDAGNGGTATQFV